MDRGKTEEKISNETKLFRESIKRLKISILKNIALMHIVYETNTLFDKFFRYIHLCLACIVFIILTVANSIDSNRISGSFSIILSGIVTFLIKLRDFIKYGDVKEASKKQIAKCLELLDRIDVHIASVDTANSFKLEQFVIAVKNEHHSIVQDNPEISHTIRKKYEEFCKKTGIPADDVADQILALLTVTVESPKEESFTEVTPIGTMTKQRLQTYMQKSGDVQSAWLKDRMSNL